MTTINALADASLAQIFEYLPLYDRLRVSEVCRRWYSISQDPWRDVTRLELDSSIPPESIGAIVRKCPNVTALFCKDQELILDDLRDITLASLRSVDYHNCSFISHDHSANKTALPLFRSEYGQSMEELVLHEHNFGEETRLSERYSQRLLPNSLKRLQLSGLNKVISLFNSTVQRDYFVELAKLRTLECLLIESNNRCDYFSTFAYTTDALPSFIGLRELILPSDGACSSVAQFIVEGAMNMPKLEILVLPENPPLWQHSIVLLDLFAKHPTLRILVIPGYVDSSEPHISSTSQTFSAWLGRRPVAASPCFRRQQRCREVSFRRFARELAASPSDQCSVSGVAGARRNRRDFRRQLDCEADQRGRKTRN